MKGLNAFERDELIEAARQADPSEEMAFATPAETRVLRRLEARGLVRLVAVDGVRLFLATERGRLALRCCTR